MVTNARAFYTPRAAAGALSARHFLRLLLKVACALSDFGATNFAKLGQMLSRERDVTSHRPRVGEKSLFKPLAMN